MTAEPTSPDTPRDDSLAPALSHALPWLLLVYAVGQLLLGRAEVESARLAMALSVVSWLGFTALLILIAAAVCAVRIPEWALPLVLAVGFDGWFLLTYATGDKVPPIIGTLAMLFMVVAMSASGRALVTWVIKEANLLPIVLVLIGLIDIWGVTIGFTAKVAEHTPAAIAKASAALPAVASKTATAFPLFDLSIGPGDILFMALVLALVLREGFDLRRNLSWMYGLTIGGLLLVIATNWLIPGLVFIGAAGLIANRGRFTYTPDERKALGVAAAVVLPLMIVVGVWFHQTQAQTSTDGKDHESEPVQLPRD